MNFSFMVLGMIVLDVHISFGAFTLVWTRRSGSSGSSVQQGECDVEWWV